MYILSYLLFSLIIIIISFRNIADLQDKQLLSGNNNGESNSNTDLLQLADTIICLNDNEWENLDLFTMWFKGIGVPTSSKAKSWLEEEGITSIEAANRLKRYNYRNDYCTFSRSFVIPILERITDSSGDHPAVHLCVDKTKSEILHCAAILFLHKFLFKGRISFSVKAHAKRPLPTPKELMKNLKIMKSGAQRTKHTGIIGVPKNTWKKRERRINNSRSLPKLMMMKNHLFCTGNNNVIYQQHH